MIEIAVGVFLGLAAFAYLWPRRHDIAEDVTAWLAVGGAGLLGLLWALWRLSLWAMALGSAAGLLWIFFVSGPLPAKGHHVTVAGLSYAALVASVWLLRRGQKS